MSSCRTYLVLGAAFLLAAVHALPLPAQNLSRDVAARILAERPAYRDRLGNVVPRDLDRALEPGRHVPGELVVRFKPGALVLPAGTSALDLTRSADVLRALPKVALRVAFTEAGVREARRAFRDAEPGKRIVTEIDGFHVDLPDLADIFVLKLPERADLRAEIARFEQLPEVLYAEPSGTYRTTDVPAPPRPLAYAEPLVPMPPLTPADPYFSNQWALEQTNDQDIDATGAWGLQTGNPTVKIAIIDTGTDHDHPDLGAGLGVGYEVSAGYDYYHNDGIPDDYTYNSHGTKVAGLVGALTHNLSNSGSRQGLAGVAGGWGYNAASGTGNLGARLIPLKIFGASGVPATDQAAANAIRDAANPYVFNAEVLNNSWGGGPNSQIVHDAINYAFRAGRVVVFAKGNSNSGNINYPSDLTPNWILSVGATTQNGRRATPQDWGCGDIVCYGSNYGHGIDVVAPGTSVMSTTRFSGYGTESGTSMAAPHAAGLAALIVSEFREQRLSWNPEVAQEIIKATAQETIPDAAPGYDAQYGHGQINAAMAVARMRLPYTIYHSWTLGGTVTASSGTYSFELRDGPLPAGFYVARRHTADKTVTITGYDGSPDLFCRGGNVSTAGWSAESPNFGTGFCEVIGRTPTSATLRTYLYETLGRSGHLSRVVSADCR